MNIVKSPASSHKFKPYVRNCATANYTFIPYGTKGCRSLLLGIEKLQNIFGTNGDYGGSQNCRT
ncbi:hypothetical protein, partial [Escherichia coli]|uniref:hypothetical protein n=1 Tax=Escherichia coli TaxID=562 RepID=UPI001964C00F